MSFDSTVNVNVASGAAPVSKASFGLILHMTTDQTMADSYKAYSKNSEAANDSELGTTAKAAAAAYFGQDEHPPTLLIGNQDTDAAQAILWTVAGVIAEGDVFNIAITPFGGSEITGTATAGPGDVAADVAGDLRADLTSKLAAEDLTVGGSGAEVTITADIAGDPFAHESSTTSSAGTITATVSQANVNVGTCLDTILLDAMAAGQEFYCITGKHNDTDAARLAAWALANGKLAIVQSDTSDIIDGTTPNIAYDLQLLSNDRAVVIYHNDDSEYVDIAIAADRLAADPDSRVTVWADATLSGVSYLTVTDLTAANEAQIVAYNANYYSTLGGIGAFGKGVLSSGDFIDERITKDWLDARIAEAVWQLRLDMANRRQKIPYTDEGIAMLGATILGVMKRGEALGHLDVDSASVTLKRKSQCSQGDIDDRKISLVCASVISGAIYEVEINLYLS